MRLSSDDFRSCFGRTPDSESVAFSLSDLLARDLNERNCMSLILKMKTSTESGLLLDNKITVKC